MGIIIFYIKEIKGGNSVREHSLTAYIRRSSDLALLQMLYQDICREALQEVIDEIGRRKLLTVHSDQGCCFLAETECEWCDDPPEEERG